MATNSLGLGIKLASLIFSTLILSGCYKIEIKETLNLDGTSLIATTIDMSAMTNAVTNMAENISLNTEGAGALTEVPTEDVVETYASCSDTDLLARYGAEALTGPEKIVTTLQIEKKTSCAASKTDGNVDITVEEIDTISGDIVSVQTLERKAESCEAPAMLAFYQVSSFDEPIIETYPLERTVDISCSDARNEITVNTITSFEGKDDSVALTEKFLKPAPVTIADNTLAELEALTMNAEDLAAIEPETTDKDIEVCSEIEQNPNEMAFFFTGCENTAPGVGVLSFKKFDTTGLKINANGTVTYRLNTTTEEFNDEIDTSTTGNEMDGLTANMMGIEMKYVFVSPWPILEHSAGQLTDEYTLVIDLMTQNDADNVTVTLDTDGATLDLVTPKTQLQIDNLIASLEEKLTSSTAPVERQVEYIYHLSSKIQRLAELKPSQQVPLGYLQTKLIGLAEDLQIDPLAKLEADFMSEMESLDAEVFAEEDEEERLETESSIEEEEITEEEPETQTATDETMPTTEINDETEAQTTEVEPEVEVEDNEEEDLEEEDLEMEEEEEDLADQPIVTE